MKGKIYLLPMHLGGERANTVIPSEVQEQIIGLRHFAVENIKTARRYLRKLDREFPIDTSAFYSMNKKTDLKELQAIIKTALDGNSVGVLPEAGCPGIADPGSDLVALAHSKKIQVVPLVGPSSILLALMGSGFSGQHFTFHGYLPKQQKDRIRKLKDFASDTRRTSTTHIFMDTPFRNMHVLEDLLNELPDTTQICIASNLTTPTERIQTLSVKEWREKAYDLNKIPAMFLIGQTQ